MLQSHTGCSQALLLPDSELDLWVSPWALEAVKVACAHRGRWCARCGSAHIYTDRGF